MDGANYNSGIICSVSALARNHWHFKAIPGRNFISTSTELDGHGNERWPTEVTSNTYHRGAPMTQSSLVCVRTAAHWCTWHPRPGTPTRPWCSWSGACRYTCPIRTAQCAYMKRPGGGMWAWSRHCCPKEPWWTPRPRWTSAHPGCIFFSVRQ